VYDIGRTTFTQLTMCKFQRQFYCCFI